MANRFFMYDLPLPRGPLPDAPPALLVRALLAVRRAVKRLADALGPPELAIFEASLGMATTQLLGAVARLGVADVLAGGPMTSRELAARLKTDPDVTHRIIRVLAFAGYFDLDAEGRVSNNRLSSALRSGQWHATRAWVEYFSSPSNLATWGDFERTLKEGGVPFERVHGASIWEWFARHPEEQETFAAAMAGLTARDASSVAALYPFSEVGTLCDVGGGNGTLLSELLLRHRRLEGILYDSEGPLAAARRLLSHRGVLERVRLEAGSFFASVPRGADAYLLKNILHDWDDERCRTILSHCRAAMAPGARLLVVETLVEPNDSSHYGVLSDLQMLMACSGGRERSEGELRRLLESAGLGVRRVYKGPTLAVLEGARDG